MLSPKEFEPSGRWEVRSVYDSNTEEHLLAVVSPEGQIDSMFSRLESFTANRFVEALNNGRDPYEEDDKPGA